MSPLTTVGGIASGIDFTALADAIIEARAAPNRALERKIADNQTKSAAYLSLNGRLSALRDAGRELENASTLIGRNVDLSGNGSGLVNITATSEAREGIHEIVVLERAARERLGGEVFSHRTVALGIEGSFTVNGSEVELFATDTLDDVVARLNAAGGDNPSVSASVVTLGPGEFRLVLASRAEGAQGIQLTDGGEGVLESLGLLDAFGEKVSILQEGADALIRVDGVELSRSSNTIDDVVDGLTIQLLGADPTRVAEAAVTKDTSPLREGIERLVDAFNGVAEFMRDQATGGEGVKKPLSGDTVSRGIFQQVQSAMLVSLNVDPGEGVARLADIGVSFQINGKFTLDSAKLNEALASRPEQVAAFFAASTSGSTADIEVLRTGLATDPGEFEVVITQPPERARAEGSGFGGVITGADPGDRIRLLSLDGTREVGVDLENGMTVQEIADALDAAALAEGIAVRAFVEGGELILRHTSYGAGEGFHVELDGAGADELGIAAGEYRGKAVQGTVNGQTATGLGRVLTVQGEGPAAGISLRYSGTDSGSVGTVSVAMGVGAGVHRAAGRAIQPGEASLNAAVTRMDTSSEQIKSRTDDMRDRLEVQRRDMLRRFAAVEEAIARAQNQGMYLGSQLEQISRFQWGSRK